MESAYGGCLRAGDRQALLCRQHGARDCVRDPLEQPSDIIGELGNAQQRNHCSVVEAEIGTSQVGQAAAAKHRRVGSRVIRVRKRRKWNSVRGQEERPRVAGHEGRETADGGDVVG